MRGKRTANALRCYWWNGSDYWADEKFVYVEENGALKKLALFDEHYYKLRIYNAIPVLEIDGLRMQLVKDFPTPLDYARGVVSTLDPKGGKALDLCAGLGYITNELVKRCERVVSIEKSRAVVTLAKHNPFSRALFESAELIVGDAFEVLDNLNERFDYIVHDPPRISHAPLLYSKEFYKKLLGVCRPGAKCFHYCGSVGKNRGRKLWKEVKKRLEEAGFLSFRYSSKFQGLFFRAPHFTDP